MNAWAPSRYTALLDTPSDQRQHDYTSFQHQKPDRYDEQIMPRPQPTKPPVKVKGEHMIFVKNVPADLATGALDDLLARYEPTRIKNVYPHSHTTTVVVSFKSHDEASYAQQDMDGIRLENVVLHVEMFSKHRSVRYLREERNAHRPLGAVDEELEEEPDEQAHHVPDAAPEVPDESDLTQLKVPSAPPPIVIGGKTWAKIARKPEPLGKAPLPALAAQQPLHSVGAKHPVSPAKEVAIPEPKLKVAVRNLIHKMP